MGICMYEDMHEPISCSEYKFSGGMASKVDEMYVSVPETSVAVDIS